MSRCPQVAACPVVHKWWHIPLVTGGGMSCCSQVVACPVGQRWWDVPLVTHCAHIQCSFDTLTLNDLRLCSHLLVLYSTFMQ